VGTPGSTTPTTGTTTPTGPITLTRTTTQEGEKDLKGVCMQYITNKFRVTVNHGTSINGKHMSNFIEQR
jgi:hypothetical protein